MSDLLIIIPLYKAPHLVPGLCESLATMADELRECNASVLMINDSPDDFNLKAVLENEIPKLKDYIDIKLHVNSGNLGFIKSTNIGLRAAAALNADALLLNSDAILTGGSVREMVEVSKTDPLISVVSPRSNNATICDSPYASRFRGLSPEEVHRAHSAIQQHLPRVTYTPTAVGFCLLIRSVMLKEFGLLDEVYGSGYNEENDFILRCNQYGYRSVLANHAYVLHLGSVSFDQSSETRAPRELRNRAILDERYPEYGRSIKRYFESNEYLSQLLCSGLAPSSDDKLSVHFDARNIGAYYNGTFEHAIRLISEFARRYAAKYDVYISCNASAYEFHDFSRIKSASFFVDREPDGAPFAASIRLAQPFDVSVIVDNCQWAPIVGFLMLDTIAMDCLHLDAGGLENIWQEMLCNVNLVGFNSKFSQDQFNRRFREDKTVSQFVSLCSTDIYDYGGELPSAGDRTRGKYILLVGNKFSHKFVAETLREIRSLVDAPDVVVLGFEALPQPGVICFPSGSLSESQVNELYDEAAVVLFPSHYEGFGLPIMHALAHQRPVIARRLPVFEEIRMRTPFSGNIHLFGHTKEMVAFACTLPRWNDQAAANVSIQSWSTAAADLERGVADAVAKFDFAALRYRIQNIRRVQEIASKTAELTRLEMELNRRESTPHFGRLISTSVQDQHLPEFYKSTGTHKVSASESLGNYVAAAEPLWNAVRIFRTMSDAIATRFLQQPPRTSSQAISSEIRLPAVALRIGSSLGERTYGSIDAGWAVDQFSARRVAYVLLILATKLKKGGDLHFIVSKGSRIRKDLIDVEAEHGIRALCNNAGLKIREITTGADALIVTAGKTRNWHEFAEKSADDFAFLEEAYSRAFGRDVDRASDVWRRALSRGASRTHVACRLFSSTERLMLLAEVY